MYLEVKLQENKCGYCIKHGNGRNKVFSGKQAPKMMRGLFFDVKMLEERFDRCFRALNQQTTCGACS